MRVVNHRVEWRHPRAQVRRNLSPYGNGPFNGGNQKGGRLVDGGQEVVMRGGRMMLAVAMNPFIETSSLEVPDGTKIVGFRPTTRPI